MAILPNPQACRMGIKLSRFKGRVMIGTYVKHALWSFQKQTTRHKYVSMQVSKNYNTWVMLKCVHLIQIKSLIYPKIWNDPKSPKIGTMSRQNTLDGLQIHLLKVQQKVILLKSVSSTEQVHKHNLVLRSFYLLQHNTILRENFKFSLFIFL